MQNQLRDGMVLQLYLKSTYTYLGISSGGDVINTANPNDKHSESLDHKVVM